ncbi:hypothetical protein CR956_00400 [Candidatus Saccharibacteria bacterium]|nr:MAG: hypothetical protein CR956_00400 [Candidatus Saccharibacteria bacterium]
MSQKELLGGQDEVNFSSPEIIIDTTDTKILDDSNDYYNIDATRDYIDGLFDDADKGLEINHESILSLSYPEQLKLVRKMSEEIERARGLKCSQ